MKKAILSVVIPILAHSPLPYSLASDQAPNLVVGPDYETSGEKSGNKAKPLQAEKLQYEPSINETPLISEKNADAETNGILHYDASDELHISPNAPFIIKDEAIEPPDVAETHAPEKEKESK